jgi:hypothetical protein
MEASVNNWLIFLIVNCIKESVVLKVAKKERKKERKKEQKKNTRI